jgi:PAS domain S-box-containing protein
LQATLDSISQGLAKVDASGRVMIHNRRMRELLDLPEALMGSQPTHEEVVRFQRERGDFGADIELVEPEARSYLMQPVGKVSPDNYWRKTLDGRTLEVRSRRLPDGGMVRTFSDVTSYIKVQEALQDERQRLAWVLEATRPGIWEANLDTGELRIDDRWAEMLGHSVADLEPVSLTTWVGLVHPDDLERVQGALMAHWTGQTPFVDIDLRLRHRLGHWIWVNKRGRAHERDTHGRGRYMSGTHLEITDRIVAQEEVLALNATLEQRVSERTAALERSLRDMEAISYSIAHDLRAPLRSVNGFAALIAEETDPPLSPAVSDMFARIDSASRKMGQMLTDMLELLRVVRTDLAAVPIDLESLAWAVAEELALESPQAEMVIGHLPTVLGDATLLRQMLHNLMENALKYSRHRTPPRLALHFDDSVGAFCLRDNGMGFDMAHAGKLFGLFQRLHAGTDVPGTGVGLAIVARIIERHGGRIWAEAQPDVGASFWWTLPRP